MSARRFVGELERIGSAPSRGTENPSVLAAFLVTVDMNVADYVARVRNVLTAAIQTANEIEGGSGSLPEDLIPDWFAEATRGSDVAGSDDAASLGSRQYVLHRGEEPWNLQDWLFCFDPQLRGWAWWDSTQESDQSVVLWVDSSGEAVFPCEELRWMTYVCGASAVEGPVLRSLSEWWKSRQESAT